MQFIQKMLHWPKKKSSVLEKILIKIFPFKKTTGSKCPLPTEDSQCYISLPELQTQICNCLWNILSWTSQSLIKYTYPKPNCWSSLPKLFFLSDTCLWDWDYYIQLLIPNTTKNQAHHLNIQSSSQNLSSFQFCLQCPHPSLQHLPHGLT